MWILDSSGDFLDGKRVWLRPGKKYLFGRFQRDGVRHAVNHNSISRKHMTIEIAAVKPKDGLSPRARSDITITDLQSKKGTIVDDKRIEGEVKLEKADEHVIQLAKYQHTLRIKWEPVVFSFSFSSKEMRASDPLGHIRSRLEDLDIKTIIDYLVDHTTHVVQSKRNTAKGLQALVNGKYIVNDSYIDAVVYAATPGDLENLESLCPLEIDFESSWPDPNEHLPPAGKEPVNRPASAFAPNPARLTVFEGYTFIFGDRSQFDNLQAPINNGQGKALLYQVETGNTTAAEIVQFMRKSARGIGVGSERRGSGGVVLVRFRSPGEHEPWSIELGNEVALMTDQRVIEQREFLDAILSTDASPLCRSLPTEEASSPISPPAPEVELPSEQLVASTSSVSPPEPVLSQPSQPSQPSRSRGRTPRVRPYVSKMKTFDDGFDMESIPMYAPEEEDDPRTQVMEMDTQEQPEQPTQLLDVVKEETEEDVVSDLLPGARAMKRRRAEMTPNRTEEQTPVEMEAPKRKRPKLDVLEAARKHLEEEQQRKKEEEDSRPADMGDVDVDQLKNLAIVEEMDLPVRTAPTRVEETSDRWEAQWNGRKNFKKFRRKGESRSRTVQTVIVPLEEMTRKEFGIGEHYWSRASEPRAQPDRSGETPAAELLAPVHASPEATPDPTPVSVSRKRVRDERDSDSDDGLRFRFRRKR
ncbi:uncharacterized protein N7511_007436 [Penicillium nucicola]|uniref:uncharacterized protein n=1 Tax=Penicillium nucicola TaxID=1850975 RepID=UPI0025458964|nr:uncharacterized protein N7511_007436 [Penicillium nucicola]KAJ5757254.1 hypothetical protein N7511_007436 [Penicillium nucicola]